VSERQRQVEPEREAARRRRRAEQDRRERQWRRAEQERRQREAAMRTQKANAIASRKAQIRADVAGFAAYNRRYREAVERQWAIEAEIERLKQLVNLDQVVQVDRVNQTALVGVLV
jgi:hypothetical protein